jgi:hypothetical protein
LLETYRNLFCSKENLVVIQETTSQVDNTSVPKSAKTTSHEEIFSLIFQKDKEKPDFEVDIENLIHLKLKRLKDEISNYSLIIYKIQILKIKTIQQNNSG